MGQDGDVRHSGTATLVPTGDPSAPVATNVDLKIFPTIHRVTIVGWDLAVPVWVLALRAEAAWIHGRFFPLRIRDQLGSDPHLVEVVRDAAGRVAASGQGETIALPLMPIELERDAIQYGIGFDYTMTEAVSRRLIGSELLARSFVLLQLIETVIPEHDAPFPRRPDRASARPHAPADFRDNRLLAELRSRQPRPHNYFSRRNSPPGDAHSHHALFEARVIGGSATQEIGKYHDRGIKVGLRQILVSAPRFSSPRTPSHENPDFRTKRSQASAARRSDGDLMVLTIVSGALHPSTPPARVKELGLSSPFSLRGGDDAAGGNHVALLALDLPIGGPTPRTPAGRSSGAWSGSRRMRQ